MSDELIEKAKEFANNWATDKYDIDALFTDRAEIFQMLADFAQQHASDVAAEIESLTARITEAEAVIELLGEEPIWSLETSDAVKAYKAKYPKENK